MKASVYRRYGPPAVLSTEDVPEPVVGDESLLIRVEAASVNRSDWETLVGHPAYIRLSGAGFRRPKVPTLGSDVSGVVEAVGEAVTEFIPGDEVVADTLYAGGPTFAEYVAVPERAAVVVKPPGMSFETASAIPQSGLLASRGLSARAGIEDGQHVLINGGGGGGGSFAIQLAKHRGAEVTGVDSAAKQELMRSLGADHVLDYRSSRYSKATGPYDRILDFVGNRSMFAKRAALAPGGVYIAVGGTVPSLLGVATVGWLLSKAGSRWSSLLIAKPGKAALQEAVELVSDGAVTPAIERVYRLDEVADALSRLGSGDALGKLVVGV